MFYAITLPHGRHEIDDFGIYKDKPWSEEEKAYAAQVTRLDSDVGELLDTLRELGIDKNNLATDSAESKDLSGDRPDLVSRAKEIFAASHRPDPNWPLDGFCDELNASRKAAWKIKRERDQSGWVPENARPLNP